MDTSSIYLITLITVSVLIKPQQISAKVIESAADRNLARFLKDVNLDIIKLAYPPRIYDTLECDDPMDEIAKLIGVLREDMPSIEDLMNADHLSLVD